MVIPQWKRAELIVAQFKKIEGEGNLIKDNRAEVENAVLQRYEYCHVCLLLAVYGLYKNGYIVNTPNHKTTSIDYTGFNGKDSLNIHHTFDALALLKTDSSLSAKGIKQRLGGELSIYSFVSHFFEAGLLR